MSTSQSAPGAWSLWQGSIEGKWLKRASSEEGDVAERAPHPPSVEEERAEEGRRIPATSCTPVKIPPLTIGPEGL
eukprot:322732-Chlamydomonas_euryale.AAC.2